jgi:hypothetical protein
MMSPHLAHLEKDWLRGTNYSNTEKKNKTSQSCDIGHFPHLNGDLRLGAFLQSIKQRKPRPALRV